MASSVRFTPVLLVLACWVSSAGVSPASAQSFMNSATIPSTLASPMFRITREPVPGGGELLTVFGRLDAGLGGSAGSGRELPLVSVLRDALSDDARENDRLRYVWVHGYTSPSTTQRLASAVPFLNRRMGNKTPKELSSLPPSVIDLGAPARELWRTALWTAAQYAFFDPYGVAVKTSIRAFRRNDDDYRKAHVMRALAILALYEADTGASPVLSAAEMRDIQSRLVLAQNTLGGVVDDGFIAKIHQRQNGNSADIRGHNWELLRQRAEAEGLYFEPLLMPDGSATHALVWVARQDVEATRKFNRRFLNIRSPWGDKRLRDWKGFTETRFVDAHGAMTSAEAADAREVQLIPLALYGLDHPKIPALLIDFRDTANPKLREVSRRIFTDITRNVLSLSPYGDLQYFAGRSVYNFVTGRRGMDINQPSRLRSYSQLKLLLALDQTLNPELAAETTRLIEKVSMNPLQNDLHIESQLAEQSYLALSASARDPHGKLAALLTRDRHREFRRQEHDMPARILLTAAMIGSAGLYRHRENVPEADQLERLDVSRRMAYHRRFLKDTLASTPVVEVTSNLDDVRTAVRYLMEHGAADAKTAQLAARLFAQTRDPEIRTLALDCLAHAGSERARRELAAITRNEKEAAEWRDAAQQRLLGSSVTAATNASADGAVRPGAQP